MLPLLLSGCRGRGRAQEIAYVSAPQVILRDRVSAVYSKTGVVKNGDRVQILERERRFAEDAPTTAAEAATIILDGIKADRWRILVGPDAQVIDEMVRQSPEQAYDTDFFESFTTKAGWRIGS